MPYIDHPETIPNGRKHGKSLNLSPNGRVGSNYTSTIPDALLYLPTAGHHYLRFHHYYHFYLLRISHLLLHSSLPEKHSFGKQQ